jgi:hypothetical protein
LKEKKSVFSKQHSFFSSTLKEESNECLQGCCLFLLELKVILKDKERAFPRRKTDRFSSSITNYNSNPLPTQYQSVTHRLHRILYIPNQHMRQTEE